MALKARVPICKIPPNQALLATALEITLTDLGEGPKAAILATMRRKFGLDPKGSSLDKKKLTAAFLDTFGQEGGELLLKRLWHTLDDISGHNTSSPAFKTTVKAGGPSRRRISAQEFNTEVSNVFSQFILETMGQESHSWLEIQLREHHTSLKRSYFDADKISPILWSSFNAASDFVLNRMMLRLCTVLGTRPVRYSVDSSLREILDNLYRQVSLQGVVAEPTAT